MVSSLRLSQSCMCSHFHVILDWLTLIYLAAALMLAHAAFLIAWAVGRRPRDPAVYPGSEEHRAALASVDDGPAFNLKYWRTMSTAEQAEFDEQQLASSASTLLDQQSPTSP
ncbi:hypothetical protein [Streptomyces xantholiticus]|uniref:hypothetical protein n=1 Tax=Streptomyces xantholiticus TaxID=68285 RepID=UPI001676018B|nr:hypothetical protein [Streptomyces xantholiticus]GGW67374.1 hypothetical protein GCM10010381_60400 [Streptomyces xantholiticus]